MLELSELDVQALDYILLDSPVVYEEQEFFKGVWEIIRRVSYHSVPDGYDIASKVSEFTIQHGGIHIIYSDCLCRDLFLMADELKDWYKENYNSLRDYEDSLFLEFFLELKGFLGSTDIVYFDFETISVKYNATDLIKEIILNEETYYKGCRVVVSDTEIYYSTNKNYKIELFSEYDFIDTNIYYFNKFDLLVIQMYENCKAMCTMIENGKIIQDTVGLSVTETTNSIKRLMLLDDNLEIYSLHY